jgi:hypothetical protein
MRDWLQHSRHVKKTSALGITFYQMDSRKTTTRNSQI